MKSKNITTYIGVTIFFLLAVFITPSFSQAASDGYGWTNPKVSNVVDASCGPGKARYQFSVREYGSETLINADSIEISEEVRVTDPALIALGYTWTGSTPSNFSSNSNSNTSGSICVTADNNHAVAVNAVHKSGYHSVYGLIWYTSPTDVGRSYTGHIHLRPTSRAGNDVELIAPYATNLTGQPYWTNTERSYQVALGDLTGLHGTFDGIQLSVYKKEGSWPFYDMTTLFDDFVSFTGSPGTYTISPRGLGEGTFSWSAMVHTSGGLWAWPDTDIGFGIDKTAPTLTRTHTQGATDDSFTVTATAQDVLSGLDTYTLYVDGVAESCTVSWSDTGLHTCTVSGTYSVGSHTYYATATDDAGNTKTLSAATFTVSAPPTPPADAELTGDDCTILPDQSTCSTTLNWTFEYATNPSVWRLTNPTAQLSTSSDVPIGSKSVDLPFGATTFEARDDSGELDTHTLNAGCDTSSSFWDGTKCGILPKISVTADPSIIRSGQTTDIIMEITSTYDLTCKLYGANADSSNPLIIPHVGNIDPVVHDNNLTRPLTSDQEVVVVCDIDIASGTTVTETARVQIVGTVEEI